MTTKDILEQGETQTANELTNEEMAQVCGGFFKNCCAGVHYQTVTIEMRKAGGDPL